WVGQRRDHAGRLPANPSSQSPGLPCPGGRSGQRPGQEKSMSERRILTSSGTERGLDDSVIDKFASGLRGDLLRPDHPAYDKARRVWNGMIAKRPALIARCAGTVDVLATVVFAREHDLLVSVRGGGHNYAGKAVCDRGLVIDLSPMKGIHVDPDRRTARAQAGVRL